MSDPADARFTVDDFDLLSSVVIETWVAGLGRDWSVPAGSLEWSCLATADHVIDCVFSFALFFASQKVDGYPNFGELHALPEATPFDMVDGLRAVTTMLAAVIRMAPPDASAAMLRWPALVTGGASDFAARGALELILHGHDIASGLGVELTPPADVIERLLVATDGWPGNLEIVGSDDPWADLLERSGR